jgi:uncharacterized MnhB-related membrane protein
VVDDLTMSTQVALLGGAFVLLLLSLVLKDLVRAVAAFAGGSALLASAFFNLGAPVAGVFELTVGAGLTAVLFLVAFTLVGSGGEAEGAPA